MIQYNTTAFSQSVTHPITQSANHLLTSSLIPSLTSSLSPSLSITHAPPSSIVKWDRFKSSPSYTKYTSFIRTHKRPQLHPKDLSLRDWSALWNERNRACPSQCTACKLRRREKRGEKSQTVFDKQNKRGHNKTRLLVMKANGSENNFTTVD